jgi:uncharacterized protein
MNWFAKQARDVLDIRAAPKEVALGVAIGVFFGFTPLFGLKTLLAIGVTWLLRGNKVAAAISVTLHDVLLPIWPVLLRLEFDLGYWILSNPHVFPPKLHLHTLSFTDWLDWSTFLSAGRPILIGSVFFGVPSAVIAYFAVWGIMIERNRRKHIDSQLTEV